MLSVTHYVTHLNEKKYCNYYAPAIDTFFPVASLATTTRVPIWDLMVVICLGLTFRVGYIVS